MNNMKTKEIKIVPPDGYVIDEANSTFECIKFKPKGLTYKYIAKELFSEKEGYYVTTDSNIVKSPCIIEEKCTDANNCTTRKQAEKLLALNKLINVAKYLNGDWESSPRETMWALYMNTNKILIAPYNSCVNFGTPLFKSEELAKQAIEILGEETVKLALSQV